MGIFDFPLFLFYTFLNNLTALESNFTPYIQAFLHYLYLALKAHKDTQLCTVAVGIIGDILHALGEQSAQYVNPFMTLFLEKSAK